MRVMFALAAAASIAPLAQAQSYRFEAETGTRSGVQVAASAAGYSGSGYITGFDNAADRLQLQADVPPGLYELWVGYSAPFGKKGYGVGVGSEKGQGWMDATVNTFAADRAGLFEVGAGPTTLEIRSEWGYYHVDYLELRPATPRTPQPVTPLLSNPRATGPARHLMHYLTGIYGDKTLSGQQGPINSQYLAMSGGLAPAVSGSDLIEYSPSRLQRGSNPNNETERMIDWTRQTGGIATMMWHWNAPTGLIDQPGREWWRGFYTNATTFNFKTALQNPNSPEYALILRDIDRIAVELKKFQDARVPVLWRPLHEAQGGWFWWGAQGPDAFRALWRLTYDRLTNHHDLNNLIWVFTSSAAEQGHLAWYPGDQYVDIVGIDIYTDPASSMSGEWLDLLDHYDGRKLITLSETGTLPDAELIEQRGTRWSWFTPWSLQDVLNNYTAGELRALLGHEDVITLDELPDMRLGDADFDGQITPQDYFRIDQGRALRMTGYTSGDFNDSGGIPDADDYVLIDRSFLDQSAPGPGAAAAMLPEPAALAGMAAGLILLARRRDR
jgi:mannan endo-1,4-beta-mannosidase